MILRSLRTGSPTKWSDESVGQLLNYATEGAVLREGTEDLRQPIEEVRGIKGP